ncbi:MAG: tetratricopeptide repeat protein [Beijerinckiaceae bacterium]
MLISERNLTKAFGLKVILGGICLLGGAMLCPRSAAAFELKEVPAETMPKSALPALPNGTVPSLPTFGVDRTVKDAWRGFLQSYRSGDKKHALQELEFAAEKGDILAQWKLGRMYADGDGVAVDDYKAFKLFSRIADLHGDESRDSVHAGVVSNAFVALGVYWLDGIAKSPVKANPAHAAKAFNYAATYYGHPEAQYQLARMLLDGTAGRVEPRTALRWLNHAAEKGHTEAQAVLGRMLYLGESIPRHGWTGLMWLKVARDNADSHKHQWVVDMHRRAYESASEEDRRTAQVHADRFKRSAEKR